VAEGTEVSPAAAPYHEQRGVTIHWGELTDIEGKERFDAITLFEVLEHVRRPQDYLEAARRLLVPRGRLYLTTPNFDGLSRRLLGPRWRVFSPEHLCYYSRFALRRGLALAGFADIRLSSRNLDVSDLRRKLLPPPGDRPDYNNIAETTELRERIEANRTMVLAKAATNAVLSFWGAGDTLEAHAVASASAHIGH
jgi:SAM-dependent methyltransferase